MGNASRTPRPPAAILVATDLDGHSDRALDRAAQLARQWHATLHVVHALEPKAAATWWPSTEDTRSPDDAEFKVVERQIRRDVRENVDDLVIHVEEGPPAQVILDVAAREGCELIVIGARGPTFAGIIFHTTAEQLLRRSPLSILIVKARPRGAYSKVLIGTDFTFESRRGMETALAWFASATFTLMHVLDIPHQSLLLDDGREQELARLEHDAMASFMAGAELSDDVRRRIHTHIEHGAPGSVLREHAIAHDIELVVVGALKRGLAFRLLIEGNTTRIAHTATGDVLMVRVADAG